MFSYKDAVVIIEDIIDNYKYPMFNKYSEEKVADLVNKLADILSVDPEERLHEYEIIQWRIELKKVIRDSVKDAQAIYENDPAATSIEVIIGCYPGYLAIVYYRVANWFYKKGYQEFARYITERAHSLTGIDIHPGATIGERFAIDHGTGIVIGETTIIGNDVVIYQGVTLGALHIVQRQQVGKQRHPKIEDEVVIYANATILGGETVIGKGSIIGGNTFITKSVEPNSVIYYTK